MQEYPLNRPTRRIISRVLLLVVIGLVFGSGFLTGSAYQQAWQGEVDLSQFWQVYGLIKTRYVTELDKKKAAEGAVSGLVSSLDDPYSSYLLPEERRSLDDELRGEFEGIGAELTEKDKLITVVAPISGSPAAKAGLKAGDVIVKINETTTENMTLNQAVSKIRGPKDSSVNLTIARSGANEPLVLTITRAKIEVKSVTWRMIDSVALLEVAQFGDDTVELARQAVKEIAGRSPKSVIIDLRNNPGGYLNAVPPIAGLFLPPSIITIEKFRDGKQEELRSVEVPILPNVPLFVLVNNGSASASEILAGALQDHKRATVVGQKTFGKGSVQDVISLTNDYALRLTIAEWLTPNSRAISKVGIEPEVKVEGEKTETDDPVLNKALELAKQK